MRPPTEGSASASPASPIRGGIQAQPSLLVGRGVDHHHLEQLFEVAPEALQQLGPQAGPGAAGAALQGGDVVLHDPELPGQGALRQLVALAHGPQAGRAHKDVHRLATYGAGGGVSRRPALPPLQSVAVTMDRLSLQGLRFFGYHGARAEERTLGSHVVVDLEVETDVGPAAAADRREAAVDYRVLYECARIPAETEQFHLMEALAVAIAERARAVPGVRRAHVRVTKEPRMAGQTIGFSVAVTRPTD